MSDTPPGPEDVEVTTPDARLPGRLTWPQKAGGMVLFAHGSGSSRHSPRNQSVARSLHGRGLATLLFDLLTPAEHEADQRTRAHRFDIALLTRRLVGAVDWIESREDPAPPRIGLFGASTGAAAALAAAAQRPRHVGAVVSRGGRPDLADQALASVQAPTLLIVGGRDAQVIGLNRDAARHMNVPPRIEIVPGATHLFEEPGALDQVARLAGDFFARHLA